MPGIGGFKDLGRCVGTIVFEKVRTESLSRKLFLELFSNKI